MTWALTLCALTAPVAADAPDAWYVRVASVLPVTAPFVMPVRIAVSDVAVWEAVLGIALMLASTWALVRLGGAVYSGSVLRSGGRPRLRELHRELREPRTH